MNEFVWKIGGEAGFGIMTTGATFGKVATHQGYDVFEYAEFPSLIRGGHNTYEVVVANHRVNATRAPIDLLVCLNEDTYAFHKDRVKDDGVIVYDEAEFTIEKGTRILVHIPFKQILKEEDSPEVVKNTIALGASLALMGWGIEQLYAIIADQFAKKGEAVIKENQDVAARGYNEVIEHYKDKVREVFSSAGKEKKVVLAGNDAFALAAIAADCRVYVAYPMTPASSVLTTLAAYAQKTGMVARHSEDEIAVVNTALGSAFAGARSAVGSSGGGFALMTEAISFAGIAEIPIVVFLSMRPGPATGMPTWTEQGDLLFAVHAGHGEFPKIVLAPGDVEEMFALTLKAFDIADKYQTPVIVLADEELSESRMSLPLPMLEKIIAGYAPERGKIVHEVAEEKYLRYHITDDGISPMLIPGQVGKFYKSNSYEHVEDGHTTEEAADRIAQVDKRTRKQITYVHKDFALPEIYGDRDAADVVFVSFGPNKGIILDAMTMLEGDFKTAYIHFTHVYPMDEEKIAPLFSAKKRYMLVENNSTGQFGKLLRQECGVHIKEKFLKYDGRPIWPEELVAYVRQQSI